ncbi:hypothetical protein Tco_0354489, partial [Tanacetum coccineum]
VIGQVVACDDLDNYDKNGKAGKKKPLSARTDRTTKNMHARLQ